MSMQSALPIKLELRVIRIGGVEETQDGNDSIEANFHGPLAL